MPSNAIHGEIKWLVLLLFLFLGKTGASWGQINLSGKPGLLYVPDVSYTQEGTLRFGMTYSPIDYVLNVPGKNAEVVVFTNLTLLPRLDINFNTLKALSTAEHPVKYNDIGDRQLDVWYLLLKEKRLRPAVAIIMSSPFTVDATMRTHVVVATNRWLNYW